VNRDFFTRETPIEPSGPGFSTHDQGTFRGQRHNLRLIVQYEIATGYRMNFQTDTFFPSIPEDDKLIA
jgi:hypothetical protein